jgi:hypothetical protein
LSLKDQHHSTHRNFRDSVRRDEFSRSIPVAAKKTSELSIDAIPIRLFS